MQKFNSGLSKSITLNFSWNQFINLLKYKMEERGNILFKVNRWFPSSKLCSNCGWKYKDNITSVSTYLYSQTYGQVEEYVMILMVRMVLV